MELEVAIENLKKQLENTKKANECGLATKGEFKEDIEAIETVLQALNNFIFVMEEIIKALEKVTEERDIYKEEHNKITKLLNLKEGSLNPPVELVIESLKKALQNSISKDIIRQKINERQFELQQEYKDFKDDVRLNTLQELYYYKED